MKTLIYLFQILSTDELAEFTSKLKSKKDVAIVDALLLTLRSNIISSTKQSEYVCDSLALTKVALRKRCSLILQQIIDYTRRSIDINYILIFTRHPKLFSIYCKIAVSELSKRNRDEEQLKMIAVSGIVFSITYKINTTKIFLPYLRKLIKNKIYSEKDYLKLVQTAYDIGSQVTGSNSRSRRNLEEKIDVFKKNIILLKEKFDSSSDTYAHWLIALSEVSINGYLYVKGDKILKNLFLLISLSKELEKIGLSKGLSIYSYLHLSRYYMLQKEYDKAASILFNIVDSYPLYIVFTPSIMLEATLSCIGSGNLILLNQYMSQISYTQIIKTNNYYDCSRLIFNTIAQDVDVVSVAKLIDRIYAMNRGANYSLAIDTYTRLCETYLAMYNGNLSYARALCVRHRKYFEKRGLCSYATSGIKWGSLTNFYNILYKFIDTISSGNSLREKALRDLFDVINKLSRGETSHELLERELFLRIWNNGHAH